MALPLRLFVFDLAGTVVADGHQVRDAFVAVGQAHGLALDHAWLRSRMGWHKQRVFEEALVAEGRDPAAARGMAQQFVAEYAALLRRRPLRETPQALVTIGALEAMGVRVAFTTGFARATADLVLAAIGMRDRVSIASDEVAQGRPAPDLVQAAMRRCEVMKPAEVGVAGDTPADLQAGTAAGCGMVVGVGCGTHSLADLQRHPHTHLLPDLSGLSALVRAHG